MDTLVRGKGGLVSEAKVIPIANSDALSRLLSISDKSASTLSSRWCFGILELTVDAEDAKFELIGPTPVDVIMVKRWHNRQFKITGALVLDSSYAFADGWFPLNNLIKLPLLMHTLAFLPHDTYGFTTLPCPEFKLPQGVWITALKHAHSYLGLPHLKWPLSKWIAFVEKMVLQRVRYFPQPLFLFRLLDGDAPWRRVNDTLILDRWEDSILGAWLVQTRRGLLQRGQLTVTLHTLYEQFPTLLTLLIRSRVERPGLYLAIARLQRDAHPKMNTLKHIVGDNYDVDTIQRRMRQRVRDIGSNEAGFSTAPMCIKALMHTKDTGKANVYWKYPIRNDFRIILSYVRFTYPGIQADLLNFMIAAGMHKSHQQDMGASLSKLYHESPCCYRSNNQKVLCPYGGSSGGVKKCVESRGMTFNLENYQQYRPSDVWVAT